LEAGFQSVDDIASNLDLMETWSQLCLRHLYM
jgi:hypothetical protein